MPTLNSYTTLEAISYTTLPYEFGAKQIHVFVECQVPKIVPGKMLHLTGVAVANNTY